MQKSFAILALCGLALFTTSGLATAEETGLNASADAIRIEQTPQSFRWEDELKQNPAANSIRLQREYSVPYGFAPVGLSPADIW